MEYISRHMENRVLDLSKSYSAILLTGPRQAGKTTMLDRSPLQRGTGAVLCMADHCLRYVSRFSFILLSQPASPAH